MNLFWSWIARGVWVLLAVLAIGYLTYITWPQAAPDTPAGKATEVPGSASADPVRDRPIRIGWTAWADAEVVAHMAKRLLESRMDYEVELVMADIGIQYQGVAGRNLDLMLMAWLPVAHQNYWQRVATDVVNLGPLYTRARLGWAVPSYVPRNQLNAIPDLKKPRVRQRINGEIQGIDPGSGLMQVSERALKTYGLSDIELVSSGGAVMTGALARAVRREEWIVVTAWSPHWMFARWDLRYLRDPKGVMGGRERVHALARPGFYQSYPPEVTEFFTRMFIPLSQLQETMLESSETSVDQAVEHYIEAHPARVHYWVTGELAPAEANENPAPPCPGSGGAGSTHWTERVQQSLPDVPCPADQWCARGEQSAPVH